MILEESEDLMDWVEAATLGLGPLVRGEHEGETPIAPGPPWLRFKFQADGGDSGPGRSGEGPVFDVDFEWE